MMRDYPEIIEHYGSAAEHERLASPVGRLEMLRTQSSLERFLPEPPALVYDVGGGTGPYASWLAARGYEAHLIDLVPDHIEQARRARSSGPGSIRSFAVGDARQLDVDAEVADAVLLLGPLYHLPEHEDRLACWREAHRILRPGGVVVAAIISRFASLLDGLHRNLVADPAFRGMLEKDLASGVHRNETDNPEYFTTAYLQRPSEAETECLAAGLALVSTVAVEGPAWLLPDLEEWMAKGPQRQRLLDLIARVEAEPSLLGVSAHILIVARKPE